MSDSYPVRTVNDDEWPKALEVDGHAFGNIVEPEVAERHRALVELPRTIGAFDGDTLCGIASAYSFDLTVPGAVLPAAGVSWVGVLPVYRRRGVLRSLMTHQLHSLRENAHEAIAILWASEPPIYGRFGYGLATRCYSLTVPRSSFALRRETPQDPTLRLRIVDAEDWKATADVYARAALSRPGFLGRDERWHSHSVMDVASRREGKSPLRCVVAEDASGPRGYVRYSTKPDWSSGQAAGTVHVREVMAVDGPALATLYAYLFDMDLMATTELWNVATDDPLLHWLTNIRGASPRLNDALYVRILDVGEALSQRAYSAQIDTIIDVSDELCPWNAGRWRLTGGPDGARCERLADATKGKAADLSLAVVDLGAAYLGGTTLAELSLAGRVQEQRPGALSAASAAFSWSPAPWCPVVF
jgi:predicted acetyltransferase